MKKSPQLERLEEILRSSRLSAFGFLGDDKRSLWEILDADARQLAKLGRTKEEVAQRMRELSDIAGKGLGDRVEAGDNLEVSATDPRGVIACPWPHAFRANKTVTYARRTDTGEEVYWSDLSIHLIEEHGFFQGKGSPFRLEPDKLVEIIF